MTLTSTIVRFLTAALLGTALLSSGAMLVRPAAGAPPNTIANSVAICDPWSPQSCAKPDNSGNLPVTGTFSATLGGFAPATTGTPISVTTGGDTGTLPAGTVVVATNVGATAAYCKLGASATTSDQYISPGGGWFAFTVGAATQLTCITASSTTTINMVGGSGLPTGTGGGSGGGGSGGAVYGPTANGAAAANPPVVIGGTANGTGTGNVGNWKVDASGTGFMDMVAGGNMATAFATGVITNGAAPPSTSIYMGANSSGATGGLGRGLIVCDQHVYKHITTATDTLAVQGVASQTIYICGYTARAAGTATWYLENTASTNANCASTLTQLTGVATETANSGMVVYSPFWGGLKNTSGNGLCINSTGTGGVDIDIWYAQF